MEIGIDSFAATQANNGDSYNSIESSKTLNELIERIVLADTVGLDTFGIGQHFRKEFLDASPEIILAAAASRTKRIKLMSAVTVLSAADPVRVFQDFATLDLISQGRAEIIVGRGSFTEAYPLFGLDLQDYDDLFIEKLNLLLEIRKQETVTWSGEFRPALFQQPIYPRPWQEKLPVWVGVGGTPASFIRAGKLGLPLMVAVIGGETHRFKPLIDLYREAGEAAGHPPEQLKVGLHSLGYVGKKADDTIEKYYPGYAEAFTRIGKERGWPPVTRRHFDAQIGPKGAIVIGDPEMVAEKILRHSEALGGINRFTFQMVNSGLSHSDLMRSIELIGDQVVPIIKQEVSK